MSENSNLSNSNSGYTPQGQMVAAHWTRLAPTYESALEWLRAKGIDPYNAKVEDLHGLDMMHMGELAATDLLADMASTDIPCPSAEGWRSLTTAKV